jgi:hypothetical protein
MRIGSPSAMLSVGPEQIGGLDSQSSGKPHHVGEVNVPHPRSILRGLLAPPLGFLKGVR